jgi:hypothetical protein
MSSILTKHVAGPTAPPACAGIEILMDFALNWLGLASER